MLNTKTFLSVDEVADFLRVHPQTVRRWVHAGRLPAAKIGQQYRISVLELERFLSEGQVSPKVRGRSPFEPSFNDVLAEERRAGGGEVTAWSGEPGRAVEVPGLLETLRGVERGEISAEDAYRALMEHASR